MTRGYRARAAVAAERAADGRTRLTRLRSDGPLAPRAADDAVYLVGAAAGPLGGDELDLELTVGAGARLAVRSSATSVALPGDGPSGLTVRAVVGPGGHLDFAPEPTVAAAGCDHRAAASVALAAGATLRWREELVLGRYGERPGRHTGRLDVTYCGAPLLRHELCLDDPGTYGSGAVLGGAGASGAVLLVGEDLTREPYAAEGLSLLPLAGGGALISATAENSAVLRQRLVHGESVAWTAGEPDPNKTMSTGMATGMAGPGLVNDR
ncbi:urease accessory protein UreD [Spirillospora sp. CA-128828]|uniref:urease accessory protein UreD n=1 Tax=Spirillospora sp. CA-128828 TaxID=3240033 RepID=UPI003D8A6452